MVSLTLYYTSTASTTLVNAGALGTATGGTQSNGTWGTRPSSAVMVELRKAVAANLASAAYPGTPSGYGQLLEATTLEGQRIPAGTWTCTMNIKYTTTVWTGRLAFQVWKRSSGGVYTQIGSGDEGADTALTTAYVARTASFTTVSPTDFVTGDKLYLEVYFDLSVRPGTSGSIQWYLSTTATGVATAQIVTPGYSAPPVTYTRTISGVSSAVQALNVGRPVVGVSAALSGPQTLTLYGSSVPDATLTSACDMVTGTGGAETSKTTTINSGAGNYGEVTSKGLASSAAVAAIPTLPTGNGWVYSPGQGNFALGNWSASCGLGTAVAVNPAIFTIRFFRLPGGVLANAVSIGTVTSASVSTSTSRLVVSFGATSMPLTTFAASDVLYIDLWLNDGFGVYGDNPMVWESSTSAGVASDMQITTSLFTASTGVTYTRPISGVSAAVQALGVPRPVTSVSAATKALDVSRPLVSISAATKSLGRERPIIGVSTALKALDVKRPISGVSASLSAPSLTTYTRTISGVSAAFVRTSGRDIGAYYGSSHYGAARYGSSISAAVAVALAPITRPITGVSSAVQATGVPRNVTGITGATQALGITRPIVSVSGATQALGLTRPVVSLSTSLIFTGTRPIIGVSSALLASQVARPVANVSTSPLLFTGSRPITGVSGATKALDVQRTLAGVSVSVGAGGISRTIIGVSTALQALGVPRTIAGVSVATLQPGITRPITSVSTALVFTGSRPITGISTSPLLFTGARPLVGVSAATQAFGVTRPLASVSAAIGVSGVSRPITGISAATKALGVIRDLSGISGAAIQVGITRPLSPISASVSLTRTRTITGVSSALKALGVERPLITVSAATKALGVTRPLGGITGAIGQGGITRTISGVSVAVQAIGVARSLVGVSSALQAIGVSRPIVGVSGATKQIGLVRDISGVSVALAQTVSRTLTPISSAVQATVSRTLVGISSSVTLRSTRPLTGISGAVKALGVSRPITGILGAIGVAGLTRTLTDISASVYFEGKFYTYITVIGTRGNITTEGARGTITVEGARGTITVQED